MSDNNALQSGDFPECPVCSIKASVNINVVAELRGEEPPSFPPGTGLSARLYADLIFRGPLPDFDVMTQMGFKMKWRPGVTQMLALVHPTKPPLLAAIKLKMLVVTQDICEKCGTVWVTHWEIQEVMAQAQVQGPPGMMGPKFDPRLK